MKSNNKIVEDISQLSGCYRGGYGRVQSRYMRQSQKNLEFVQQVKAAVNHIKNTSDEAEEINVKGYLL